MISKRRSSKKRLSTLPPAISLVGASGSGKTELICRLLAYWQERQLRVAVVKHSHKELNPDQPGKDSWRFRQGGARAVALAGPKLLQIIQDWPEEPPLTAVLESLPQDLDLILVEGYKRGPLPKLVMAPPGCSLAELEDYPQVLGFISDEPLPTSLPVWRRDEIVPIAAFIEAYLEKNHPAGPAQGQNEA